MLWYVCKMTDDFQWEGLRSFSDEDAACTYSEHVAQQFPHAYVDVLTFDEYHGGKAKWQQIAIAN